MNLGALPEDQDERLAAYRRAKEDDKEWWEIQRIKFKMNLGEELTNRELLMYGHSKYGSANSHNF